MFGYCAILWLFEYIFWKLSLKEIYIYKYLSDNEIDTRRRGLARVVGRFYRWKKNRYLEVFLLLFLYAGDFFFVFMKSFLGLSPSTKVSAGAHEYL